MNTNHTKFIVLLIAVVLALNTAIAQQPTIITDSIFSKTLNEYRKLKIRLPEEYKPGDSKKYDVVYMIDGEWNFDIFSYTYKFAKDENFLPPLIFVALPNTYTSEGNMRDRDFLPEPMVNNKKAGGADKFLAFIRNEAMPYVNSRYSVSGDNSLFGHSYGGVFTMYVLLKAPDMFSNYYCSDPAFHYNDRRLVKMAEETFTQTPELNKTLWINGIESTYMYMGIAHMDTVLKAKAPKGLRWKISLYPNETHNSVRYKGVYDGMKYVYDGYTSTPLVFHPMNGSLLAGKPTRMFLMGNLPDVHYTTDGSEPTTACKAASQMFEITGPATLTLKSFGGNKKYGATAKGNFELTKVWPALPGVKNVKNGGLRYTYYEGKWEKLPDFTKLKSVKTGIADSTFTLAKLPGKSNYGCVFDGYIKIDMEGYYIFILSSDDGSKLVLNGREIINNDGVHGGDNPITYVVPLQKGYYPIHLEYFQGEGENMLHLQYLLPNKNMPEDVPFGMMYYK
jgi:predicted alpha/beta superfamily hydrolase